MIPWKNSKRTFLQVVRKAKIYGSTWIFSPCFPINAIKNTSKQAKPKENPAQKSSGTLKRKASLRLSVRFFGPWGRKETNWRGRCRMRIKNGRWPVQGDKDTMLWLAHRIKLGRLQPPCWVVVWARWEATQEPHQWTISNHCISSGGATSSINRKSIRLS